MKLVKKLFNNKEKPLVLCSGFFMVNSKAGSEGDELQHFRKHSF
jgi:hypothetical protein